MSLGKKLLGFSLGYAVYQIVTDKRYEYLQNDLKSVINTNREKIIEILDKLDLLVSTPTEIGNEKNRLIIEEEIFKIKQRLAEYQTKQTTNKANEKV